jgi:ribonuclease-3
MSEAISELPARLGYAFRDPALLARALTHPSFAAEKPGLENNQRLEFLGDAVLQILLAETLFHLFPTEREGVLSKRRSLLVNQGFLATLAREIGLDALLRLADAEDKAGGRQRVSALGDAFEAVVGALYLDSDLATTRRVVLDIYGDLAGRLAATEEGDNPKGRLQERVQPLHGNHAVRYEVISTEGEDHARSFHVEVFLLERPLGRGHGTSKKLAEEAAARAALAALGPSAPPPPPEVSSLAN